jgi:hypothetical protein
MIMKLYLTLYCYSRCLARSERLVGMRLSRRLSQAIACSSVWASFACSAAFLALQGPVRMNCSWFSAFDLNAGFSVSIASPQPSALW